MILVPPETVLVLPFCSRRASSALFLVTLSAIFFDRFSIVVATMSDTLGNVIAIPPQGSGKVALPGACARVHSGWHGVATLTPATGSPACGWHLAVFTPSRREVGCYRPACCSHAALRSSPTV